MSLDEEAQTKMVEAVNHLTTTIGAAAEQMCAAAEAMRVAAELIAFPQRFVMTPTAPPTSEEVLQALSLSPGPLIPAGFETRFGPDVVLDPAGPDVVVHACPIGDSNAMPCCGVPAAERKMDRITTDDDAVTCRGPASGC